MTTYYVNGSVKLFILLTRYIFNIGESIPV